MFVGPNCYFTKLTIALNTAPNALKLKTADLKIRLNGNFHPFEGLSVTVYVELVRMLNIG